uniref:Uncharacterized protein n=1 Tax=Timema cristinae TaxID=61476 RepID=A0A7R9CHH5_TIMCR|nr:unnamed protein product [Timema cristinae]
MTANGTAVTPPVDFSFLNLYSIEEMSSKNPRRGVKRYHRAKSGRLESHALRLNNNQLTSIQGINAITYQERKRYKEQIIHRLPNLRSLDFTNVTQTDRRKTRSKLDTTALYRRNKV